MILRLRHTFPILQSLSGSLASGPWTTPLLRPFARVAAFAGSGPDPEPATSPVGHAAEEPKKKRRSTAGSRGKGKTAAEAAAAAAETEASTGAANAADAAGASVPATASKRRASTRRKAVSAEPEVPAAAQEQQGGGVEAAPAPAAPPAKRSRKKKVEVAEAAPVEAAAPVQAAPVQPAPVAVGAADGGSGGKEPTTKRAAKAAAVEVDDGAITEGRTNMIEALPYEDFYILPRKAEQALVALGLRQPQVAAPHAAGAAQPAVGPVGRQVHNVLQLSEFMHVREPRHLVAPLLTAAYQGHMGRDPDLLYDLFCLDYEGGFLPADAVMDAAVAEARAARTLLSATGLPPTRLLDAALKRLREAVGPGAVEGQERVAPGLTEAQVTLFLLDFASADVAGKRPDDNDLRFSVRRCAALQLTQPSVLARLGRYVVEGAPLPELAAASGGGGKAVRLSQPMLALLDGLKAGVRMDRERLLNDFRLGEGAPLHEHLPEFMRRIEHEALNSPDPGNKSYYDSLVGKLKITPKVSKAVREQERQWEAEQKERDGSALTVMQARLLFHIWRRDRFCAEQQGAR